jgi:hypothetical protein
MEMKVLPGDFSPTSRPQKLQIIWEAGEGSGLPAASLDLWVTRAPVEEIKSPRARMQAISGIDGLPVWVAENSKQFWLWRPGLSLHLDFPGNRGEARFAGLTDWQNVLRVIYSQVLLRRRGLLLHAAGVVRQQKGYIFPGPSGAGKSTIVRLSTGVTVLSDEIVAVQLSGKAAMVRGIPLNPEGDRLGAEVSARVSAIYFPIQAPENRVALLKPREVATRLYPCVYSYATRRPQQKRLFTTLVQLSGQVPGFALYFRPSPELWQVIDGP